MMRTPALAALSVILSITLMSSSVMADNKGSLIWSGPFHGPVKQSSIWRAWDASTGVLCYILRPDYLSYRYGNPPAGYLNHIVRDYAADAVGSISCVRMTAPALARPEKKK